MTSIDIDQTLPGLSDAEFQDRKHRPFIENRRRARSKIANLPKTVRDKINQMLYDGATYAQIIAAVSDVAPGLHEDNLSRPAASPSSSVPCVPSLSSDPSPQSPAPNRAIISVPAGSPTPCLGACGSPLFSQRDHGGPCPTRPTCPTCGNPLQIALNRG